jgi:hypothetical protein
LGFIWIFFRINQTLFGGECKLCDCNGHSATCDPITLKCDVRVEEVFVPVDVPVVANVVIHGDVANAVNVTVDNFVVVVVVVVDVGSGS